jgi:hypothetical protein
VPDLLTTALDSFARGYGIGVVAGMRIALTQQGNRLLDLAAEAETSDAQAALTSAAREAFQVRERLEGS